MLLGMRPDLAEDLAPENSGIMDGDRASVMHGQSENAAVKTSNDQLECVNGCKVTDQSCRARCLGVPGGAARKMPRKQDISGNLPLNWRVAKDEPLGSKKDLAVTDSNNAVGIPALSCISMVLLLTGYSI
ncbi:hypothetical protein GGF41_001864 [Coemansia sp. RSA 2531]|nr:hypothetical protein GGF41_001864 [Coemansia sp. RSA 2531]